MGPSPLRGRFWSQFARQSLTTVPLLTMTGGMTSQSCTGVCRAARAPLRTPTRSRPRTDRRHAHFQRCGATTRAQAIRKRTPVACWARGCASLQSLWNAVRRLYNRRAGHLRALPRKQSKRVTAASRITLTAHPRCRGMEPRQPTATRSRTVHSRDSPDARCGLAVTSGALNGTQPPLHQARSFGSECPTPDALGCAAGGIQCL